MTQTLVRPIRQEDLEILWEFSNEAGAGFINLPKNRTLLEKRIAHSIESFKKDIVHPHQESYFFVLELFPEKKVIGICGILSRIGVREPFCYYAIKNETIQNAFLHCSGRYEKLEFKKERRNPTEICALYLHPSYRHHDFGYLLSYSRFLFMKQNRKRFTAVVMAELRGYFDEKGRSPFWEAIGKHFFKMDFEQANILRITHPEVIEDIFPKETIYTTLLPKSAQKVIGKTHPQTLGALKLLELQGFNYNQHIDLFEAGPHFSASIENILAIKAASIYVVKKIQNKVEGECAIIANDKPLMYATMSNIQIEDLYVTLDANTAKLVEIDVGDKVCILKNYKGKHV